MRQGRDRSLDGIDRGVLGQRGAQTFFATLNKELVYRCCWPTRDELISEIYEFVEAFYNRTRRHSTSPVDFEEGPRISAASDPR